MAGEYYDGIILKGIGGFYYVDTAAGTFECKARGIFRKEGITPLAGDTVTIRAESTEKQLGSITEIKPRSNVMVRPPVANITQLAIVTAAANPKPNVLTLDKLICEAEYQQINILLCLNKTDLDPRSPLAGIYRNAGFDVLELSALDGKNIDLLRERLDGQVTAFAGNSGVGKSSLMNRLVGSATFETGEVSGRVERGRHTTRHSELVKLPGGGFLIDTPGFSSFELRLTAPQELAELFREFRPYAGECRFHDCSHISEKGCAILTAVKRGEIAESRHNSYCHLYEKLKQLKPWENK